MTEPIFNPAAIALMMRMRILIKKEFGETLPLREKGVERRFCDYGFKSKQPQLAGMAKQLAELVSLPVSDKAEDSHNAVTPAPSEQKRSEEPPQTAHASFLELLDSERVAQASLVQYTGIPPFIIDKPRYRCLLNSTFHALAPLAMAAVAYIRLEPVTPDELSRQAQKANTVSLDAFMWFAAQRFSQGRLLSKPADFKAYGLSRWPDFGTLPHDREHTRMASLLMKRPSTLQGLIKEARVQEKQAIAFINASHLCGWLKEMEAPAAASRMAGMGRLGIIGRIRARLGLAE